MTEIVGILNLTPDSFSDGGKYFENDTALDRVAEMLGQGASMIDIGAESTRPGAEPITIAEEWRRLEPVLNGLRRARYKPNQFMIDTRHGEIVERTHDLWGDGFWVNDVSTFHDHKLVRAVVRHSLMAVMSHLPASARGNIQAAHKIQMQDAMEVLQDLNDRLRMLAAGGFDSRKITLDPGIGFGKAPALNRELVEFAGMTDSPVMIGYSQKRFIGENRYDAGTNVGLGRLAAMKGAEFLRVHHVQEHSDMLRTLPTIRELFDSRSIKA